MAKVGWTGPAARHQHRCPLHSLILLLKGQETKMKNLMWDHFPVIITSKITQSGIFFPPQPAKVDLGTEKHIKIPYPTPPVFPRRNSSSSFLTPPYSPLYKTGLWSICKSSFLILLPSNTFLPPNGSSTGCSFFRKYLYVATWFPLWAAEDSLFHYLEYLYWLLFIPP